MGSSTLAVIQPFHINHGLHLAYFCIPSLPDCKSKALGRAPPLRDDLHHLR